MKDVRTVEDAMKACDRFMVGNGYLSRVPIMGGSAWYMVEKKGRDNPSVTDKLFTTLHIRSTDQFEWHFTKKAQSEQFGVPKREKFRGGIRSAIMTEKTVIQDPGNGSRIPIM